MNRFRFQLEPSAFVFDRRDPRFSPALPPPAAPLVVEKLSVDEAGLHTHFRDHEFPMHGFPFAEAVAACDIVKRHTLSLVRLVRRPEFKWVIRAAALMPWPLKRAALQAALDEWTAFAERTLNTVVFPDGLTGTVILQADLRTPVARVIYAIVEEFFAQLALDAGLSRRAATIAATLVDYDDAYRYRLQDLAGETTNYDLRVQPAAELERLAGLLAAREHDPASRLIELLSLARLAFLSGQVRAVWRTALFNTERQWHQLRPDAADRYWMAQRPDYVFGGAQAELNTPTGEPHSATLVTA